MHGKQKAVAVSELAERRDLDLEHCFAYSDSNNDIPLLTQVGNPVVINPDSGLRNHAQTMGWPIHDFRREHLRKRYAVPAGATAIALIGAGAGIALAAARNNKKSDPQ